MACDYCSRSTAATKGLFRFSFLACFSLLVELTVPFPGPALAGPSHQAVQLPSGAPETPITPISDDGTVDGETPGTKSPDASSDTLPRTSSEAPPVVDIPVGAIQCTPCKSGFYRTTEDTDRGPARNFPRRRSWERARGSKTSPGRRSNPRSGRCRATRCLPCSVCPRGHRLLSNCTSTRNIVCSPCPVGRVPDPVSGSCKIPQPLRHDILVEGLPPTVTLAKTQAVSTPPVSTPAPLPPRLPPAPARPILTQEADDDGLSPPYIASLFAHAAAGVSILVLLVVLAFYFHLRCKRWREERAFSKRDICLIVVPCYRDFCDSRSRTGNDSQQPSAEHHHLNPSRQHQNQISSNATSSGAPDETGTKTAVGQAQTRASPRGRPALGNSSHGDCSVGAQNPRLANGGTTGSNGLLKV